MAKLDTLWTCVGITKHVGSKKEVIKVRCGLDLIRRIKSAQSEAYIRSKGENLKPVRADFIELPQPMLKMDALKFALAAPEFQSPEDQALIQEQIDYRMPKQPKARKPRTVKVRASKTSAPSLDSIKSRGRKSKASVSDVLSAVATAQEQTSTAQ